MAAPSRALTHFVDAMRMCIAIAAELGREISAQIGALEAIEVGSENRDVVVRLLLALWSLVDTAHRLRELVQQAPHLRRKTPELQVFLRATADVETLRHYAQHLRTQIAELPAGSTPIWGAVSWVSRKDPSCCLTLFAGSLHPEISSYTVSYDTWERRFTAELILGVNNTSIDVPRTLACIEALSPVVEGWAATNACSPESRVVPVFTVRVAPRTVRGDAEV